MAGTKRTFDEMSTAAQITGLPPMTASLLESGEWSDLVIKCGEKLFNVHRVIVGLQSKPLAAHLKHDCVESATGTIDLKDDEPDIVKLLIDFLYTGDFIISTEKEAGTVQSDGGDNSPTATHTVYGGEEQEHSPQEVASGASKALITAVKVYIIADKYDVPPLKLLSKTKYETLLPFHWNSNSFTESLQLIFEETTENDRLLKDVAINFAGGKCRELMDRGEFVNLLKDDGEMAVEILRASLPKTTTPMAGQPNVNPVCAVCGSSDSVVLARNKSKQNPGNWWCHRCRCRFS